MGIKVVLATPASGICKHSYRGTRTHSSFGKAATKGFVDKKSSARRFPDYSLPRYQLGLGKARRDRSEIRRQQQRAKTLADNGSP